VNPTNARVKNEKLYATIGGDTILSQVVNARKVEKKYVQFIAIWHLLKQGYSMIDFEAFKVRFKFLKMKTTHARVGQW
jgi:hypothetical protein